MHAFFVTVYVYLCVCVCVCMYVCMYVRGWRHEILVFVHLRVSVHRTHSKQEDAFLEAFLICCPRVYVHITRCKEENLS
jgi:hypothetical protein